MGHSDLVWLPRAANDFGQVRNQIQKGGLEIGMGLPLEEAEVLG